MAVLEFEITVRRTNIHRVARRVGEIIGLPEMYTYGAKSVPGLQQDDILHCYAPENQTRHLFSSGQGLPDIILNCPTSPSNYWEPSDTYKIKVDYEPVIVSPQHLRDEVRQSLKPWWQRLGERFSEVYAGLSPTDIARILESNRDWFPRI